MHTVLKKNHLMKTFFPPLIKLIFPLLFLVFIQFGYAQNSPSMDVSSVINDDFFSAENNELINEVNAVQFYTTMDESHMFYNEDEFVNGHINYKNQTYKTKLKYDLLNDLVVIKYSNTSPVSLDPELVKEFLINGQEIVKLTKNKDLKSYYGNGFFKKEYKGSAFSFFVKHIKKLKKNTDRTNVLYSFWEETIYLIQYKDHFYKINKKRDIIKAAPHFKKEINDFFGRYRKIDQTSLLRLFIQMDSIESKRSSISP